MIFHLTLLIFLIQDGKGEDSGAKDGIFTSNVDVQNPGDKFERNNPGIKEFRRHGREEDRQISRVS